MEYCNMKIFSFFENAKLLLDKLQIIPLMYGSLGLEYITGKNLNADDIDILLPKVYINERWDEFKTVLMNEGYALIDEHEHTFQKNGICYSYAQIEELKTFAGIDGYRINVREKKDNEKIAFIEKQLKIRR